MSNLEKAIKKHNKNVKASFKRAEKGEIIDLTALMIGHENIMEKRLRLKHSANQKVCPACKSLNCPHHAYYTKRYGWRCGNY